MSYNQFIEPFVGGGAVLFSKNMSLGIVISSYWMKRASFI